MIKIAFSRTLLSQSAASVSMGVVGSYLENNNIKVDLCLIEKNTHFNALNLIRNSRKFPVLFLKPNFQDYKDNINIAINAKKNGFFKRVFLLGVFASLNAERLLTFYKEIDGILIGDAEETSLELANSMLNNNDFSWDIKIKGGIWRDPNSKKIINNSLRETKLALNKLPPPNRSIEKREKAAIANLEMSRGCIANCSFCHIPIMHGLNNKTRRDFKNVKNVVDEIEMLHKQMGKNLFIFNDSVFWGTKSDDQLMQDFSIELKMRNLNIYFMIYLRSSPFPSKEILEMLKDSGLVRVFIGVESVSYEMLKLFRKGTKSDNWLETKKILEDLNISYHIGFMLFHPYSTLSDIEVNIDYLYKIDKIFRVGVILEKMRIIPNSYMERKTEINTINEVDQAYSYSFKDRNVTLLYNEITELFKNKLHNKYISMEYFCTSIDLLATIAKRIDNNFLDKFKKLLCNHKKIKQEYQELIYNYLIGAINNFKDEGIKNVDLSELQENFIIEFTSLYFKLQSAWSAIIEESIVLYGEKFSNVLFTGEESIQ